MVLEGMPEAFDSLLIHSPAVRIVRGVLDWLSRSLAHFDRHAVPLSNLTTARASARIAE
jgi:hypothetical protein